MDSVKTPDLEFGSGEMDSGSGAAELKTTPGIVFGTRMSDIHRRSAEDITLCVTLQEYLYQSDRE